jgi:hypothetical protein
MRDAGKIIEERDGFRLYECYVDGTFSKARGDGVGVGGVWDGQRWACGERHAEYDGAFGCGAGWIWLKAR